MSSIFAISSDQTPNSTRPITPWLVVLILSCMLLFLPWIRFYIKCFMPGSIHLQSKNLCLQIPAFSSQMMNHLHPIQSKIIWNFSVISEVITFSFLFNFNSNILNTCVSPTVSNSMFYFKKLDFKLEENKSNLKMATFKALYLQYI